jgi:serine protease Do
MLVRSGRLSILSLISAAALGLGQVPPGPVDSPPNPPSTQPSDVAPSPAPAPHTPPATTRPRRSTTVPAIADLPRISNPFSGTTRPAAPSKRPVTATPDSVDELRSLERQVEDVVKKVTPATVGLQIGAGSGSGVIVSADGWVLTAGHVSDKAGQPVTIIMHDGRRLRGISMGANNFVDSGLVRILDPGPFPHAEIGGSGTLAMGQFLVAIGHPGGYRAGRSPVVRLGRLTVADNTTLTTDSTLVGGDSGGPLFDLDGRVVGIHSRIAQNVNTNMHVPVDAFVADWPRIASGEVWGSLNRMRNPFDGNPRPARMGITLENHPDGGVRVTDVTAGGPAELAGLRNGDVIYRVNGVMLRNSTEFTAMLAQRRPNDVVTVEVRRDGTEDQTIRVRLGAPATQPAPSRPRR